MFTHTIICGSFSIILQYNTRFRENCLSFPNFVFMLYISARAVCRSLLVHLYLMCTGLGLLLAQRSLICSSERTGGRMLFHSSSMCVDK
jgi:hypothetical protein